MIQYFSNFGLFSEWNFWELSLYCPNLVGCAPAFSQEPTDREYRGTCLGTQDMQLVLISLVQYDGLCFFVYSISSQRNSPFGGVVVVELEAYPRLRRSTTYPCFFFVARMMSEKRTHHLLRLNHPKAIAVTSSNITSPSHSHTPGSFQSSCLVGPTVWRSCGSSSMSIVPSFDGSNTLFCCCQVRARRHYSSTAWEQINRWGCKRHGGLF